MIYITDDELTVLLIAAQGESMMPIGRWEKPVEALVAKGYLRANDRFNNVITPEGKAVLADREKQDDEVYRDILRMGNRVQNVRQQATSLVSEAAQKLAAAARISSQITGLTEKASVESWGRELIRSALEQVK